MDFAASFPDLPEPKTGPGLSYSISPNAVAFDYELRIPGQTRMKGSLRAVDEEDAKRILLNRHPSAQILDVKKAANPFLSIPSNNAEN